MNQEKLKKGFYVVVGVLVSAFCIKLAFNNGDFKVFLEAAKLLKAGENPYNVWIFVSEGNYCLYFYSPLWVVLLTPFADLPNFIPNLIWLVANLFFLYRSWILLKQYVEKFYLSIKQLRWLLFLCLLMSFRFIMYNFGMIQMTLFLLWGCLESIRLMRDQKPGWGGVLLALVINIKIVPIVLVPYLLYRRYFKGLLYVLIFTTAFLFLPAIYTGWNQNLYLLSEWWVVINPGNAEHLIEAELGPHSLTALIPTLLTETSGALPIKRNLLHLSEHHAIMVLNIFRLALILFTLYFLKWPPFAGAKTKLTQLRELAYLILLIPLIFPHQQKYAFVLTLPALFYLSHFIVVNYSYKNIVLTKPGWYLLITLLCGSFILMTLSTDGLVGRDFNKITQHFKTITWGTLLLIWALVIAKPQITEKSLQIDVAEKMN